MRLPTPSNPPFLPVPTPFQPHGVVASNPLPTPVPSTPHTPHGLEAPLGQAPTQKRYGKMLITIRPGPVLHVWQAGKEIAAVQLTVGAALSLCRDVMAALSVALQR